MSDFFNFFKQKNIPLDLLNGFVDIHSHVLPGVDDGAKDEKEAENIITELKKRGAKKVFFTPHIKSFYPENTNEQLKLVFEKFKSQHKENINIQLAAEYMLDEFFFEKLNSNLLLTFDGVHLLIEMAFISPPINLNDIIYEIVLKEYTPVIAHPERYLYMQQQDFDYLKSAGAKFQLNLLSLSGYYGQTVMKKSLALLEKGFYDFVGTDIHRAKDFEMINKIKLSDKNLNLLSQLIKNNEKFFG